MAAPAQSGVGGEFSGGDATNGAAAGGPLWQVLTDTNTHCILFIVRSNYFVRCLKHLLRMFCLSFTATW